MGGVKKDTIFCISFLRMIKNSIHFINCCHEFSTLLAKITTNFHGFSTFRPHGSDLDLRITFATDFSRSWAFGKTFFNILTPSGTTLSRFQRLDSKLWPKISKILAKKIRSDFCKFATGGEEYYSRNGNHPSLQAIYLNIARSARPQRIFGVPNVTSRWIFWIFEISTSWPRPWPTHDFCYRIFQKLSFWQNILQYFTSVLA